MKITEIKSLLQQEIELYTKYNENQLFHFNEPDIGYFIAESPNVINRALADGYEPVSFLVESENMTEDVMSTMKKCGVSVYQIDHDIIKDIPGYSLTRGMLCIMKRKPLKKVSDVITGCKTIAILENVMNPTNVGAIMRSAAALNIDAILLTKGCADPLYKRAARVSMGTVFQVPWTFIDDDLSWPYDGMIAIKEAGFNTIAMALKDNTLDIRDEKIGLCEKKAIILGTEGTGIIDETLELCDYTVKIPMSHDVDSLNVAAASAVAFWELTR